MVEKKSQKNKQEEARHSLRCHKSRGNRLRELEASKHSSSWTILSNPHIQSLRGYFIHSNRWEAMSLAGDLFKHAENQTPPTTALRPVGSATRPSKVPILRHLQDSVVQKQRGMLWPCFCSSHPPGPTCSFIRSGNHCIYSLPTRGLWSQTDLGLNPAGSFTSYATS